ncbi:MAG: excinuclease ABC subunit A [Candidatus Jacksonbacteria bacterium RIFOXYC2_FULL_44_29]|nr:MAG: excinuclease ABC subunit A [Candidatus Jacksonbacteria bacterium RIFOXYA2_FULL_43_12]OGY77620.1 MAG: excinuclease ABC subunit A [Candidatus Jacksonbacteria bacterium RIFOXYB2_FULL_44_15]OGY80242.1 MAG: excinuclease ABC subunit A [Candidatus Jacksonbacteria bacterium RIFOXYC2_FULL_44_29]OGY81975.1 MAG: excinuclease ABC subunit A [Candidatus Jacksonbacteria bacterium RIFOXYD2_FULL_43_21]HCE49009.1 excinuclease ABC subunit A [Candidatus Jacksonbacteria bacterium]
MRFIKIKGASCHNLKNINVAIPRQKFTVVTGLSGSGKSSLIFDTLYAEAQRRYLESLASYGWEFREVLDKPEVTDIEGLSPTIAISQKFRSSNPRSTVGTLTDIYDFIRLLYAQFGSPTCSSCGRVLRQGKVTLAVGAPGGITKCCACGKDWAKFPEIDLRLFSFNAPQGACPTCQGLGSKLEIDPDLVIPNRRLSILEGAIRPLVSLGGGRSNTWQLLEAMMKSQEISLTKPVNQLLESDQQKILYGTGVKNGAEEVKGQAKSWEGIIPILLRRYQETDSNYLRSKIEFFMRSSLCVDCGGGRLNAFARAVLIDGKSIVELTSLGIKELAVFFKSSLIRRQAIARKIIEEILTRLERLSDISLSYLTLNRSTISLSGGEIQRIRLMTQLGLGLTGVIYILDEPTMGLHSRDTAQLIGILQRLQGLDNTIVVVEHDKEVISAADYIIDVGPGAGIAGGRIVGQGTPERFKRQTKTSLTARYLSGVLGIKTPSLYRAGSGREIVILGATEHNLKNIDVKIPLGKLVGVTGVSGSGKSTLIKDILARALRQRFYRAKLAPGRHQQIIGVEALDKVVMIDQSPIGRSPRSNPATYTGLFSPIRSFFASLPEAQARHFTEGQFSFNVTGGRCATCKGEGEVKIEMYFLPDVYVKCPDCHGMRYNRESLSILWRGKSIADILAMSVDEACTFLGSYIPKAKRYLVTLKQVGLGYIRLGQPATTLSGGEAQRIKLGSELSRPATGKTLYILDEPTVGLHFADVEKLLGILQLLVDKGNTVIVVEHNLDLIKSCDWLIDLGPEGGTDGGQLVACGTPRQIAQIRASYTGRSLRGVLS